MNKAEPMCKDDDDEEWPGGEDLYPSNDDPGEKGEKGENEGWPGGENAYPSNLSPEEEIVARHAQYGYHSTGDFHMHSTCSDGALAPEALVRLCASRGIKVMSLTDHDTMDGVEAAVIEGRKHGVRVVPGVEISAETPTCPNTHILAYFSMALDTRPLQEMLRRLQRHRVTRGKAMVKKLHELGYPVDWEVVLKNADGGAVGRPHIARAMVQQGLIGSFGSAFAKFLRNDGPAYVKGMELSPVDAVQMVRKLGGISVLAHPWSLPNLDLIPILARAGLQGIEVYRDAEKISMFGALAKEYGLFCLGGSDFHGCPGHQDRLPGDFPLPQEAIDGFLETARTQWEVALKDQLRAFAAQSRRAEWRLPPALSHKERAKVHQEAELAGLVHTSEGVGEKRHLCLRTHAASGGKSTSAANAGITDASLSITATTATTATTPRKTVTKTVTPTKTPESQRKRKRGTPGETSNKKTTARAKCGKPT